VDTSSCFFFWYYKELNNLTLPYPTLPYPTLPSPYPHPTLRLLSADQISSSGSKSYEMKQSRWLMNYRSLEIFTPTFLYRCLRRDSGDAMKPSQLIMQVFLSRTIQVTQMACPHHHRIPQIVLSAGQTTHILAIDFVPLLFRALMAWQCELSLIIGT